MKPPMTVGDLRRALEGLDDSLPVWVEATAISPDNDVDTLHASGVAAMFAKASTGGGFFGGPPMDRFVIEADGIPEGTCRECGKRDGKHLGFCGEGREQEDEDELLKEIYTISELDGYGERDILEKKRSEGWEMVKTTRLADDRVEFEYQRVVKEE